MANWFCEFIRYFDYFGIIFTFKLKQENKYKSRLGGMVFIFFLIFSAYYFINQMINFVWRQNYNINFSIAAQNQAPELNFTYREFKFAYALKYKNGTPVNYSQLPFLEHSLNLSTINDYNKKNKTKLILNKKPCDENDFNFTKEDYNLTSLNLTNYFCPTNNSKMFINGTELDPMFTYVDITFSINDNWLTSENLNYIKSILEKDPIYFYVIWTDTAVDVVNIENPLSYYIRSISGFLDFNFMQKLNLDFSALNFTSDSAFFFEDSKSFNKINLRDSDTKMFFIQDRSKWIPKIKEDDTGKEILKIYLRSAPDVIIYNRSYTKFDIFIGNYGGLQSNVFMVLFVIVGFLNEFWASQKVMNKILQFREHLKLKNPQLFQLLKTNLRTFKNEKDVNITKTAAIELTTMSIDKSQQDLCKDKSFIDLNIEQGKGKTDSFEKREIETSIDIDFPMKNRNLTIHHKNLFSRHKTSFDKKQEILLSNSKTPLNFSSFEIILRLCPCKTKKLDIKNKFLEKASNKMDYYFDIFTYTKKMQELDIIKYLLLDKDQVKLFDFICTPSVSMLYSDSDDVYQDFLTKKSNKIEIEDLEKTIKSYKLLKNRHEDLNNKLFYLFDYEIDHLLIG